MNYLRNYVENRNSSTNHQLTISCCNTPNVCLLVGGGYPQKSNHDPPPLKNSIARVYSAGVSITTYLLGWCYLRWRRDMVQVFMASVSLWVEVVHEHQSERKDTPPGNISPTSFRHCWGPMGFPAVTRVFGGICYCSSLDIYWAWEWHEDDLYNPGLGPWIKHPNPWAAMPYIHPSVVKQSYGFQISDSDTEHDGLWKKVFLFNYELLVGGFNTIEKDAQVKLDPFHKQGWKYNIFETTTTVFLGI